MKERLLGFIFCAILAGFAINLALDAVHHAFSTHVWFQTHWVIFYVAIPALLLLGLAFWMGFFRPNQPIWGHISALLAIAAVIYLMLGAGYSCWKWCL